MLCCPCIVPFSAQSSNEVCSAEKVYFSSGPLSCLLGLSLLGLPDRVHRQRWILALVSLIVERLFGQGSVLPF